MFQIQFSDVAFTQASKYVMIVKNNQQTKRSQVCSLWTSIPRFDEPVVIDSLDDLIIKACIATIDRKLTAIGSFKIEKTELHLDKQIILQVNKNFIQNVEDKEVCVGNCKIKITKKSQMKDEKKIMQDIDEEFQLKSQSEQQQKEQEEPLKCQLKFIIHGGFDFYLNAGFKVCIKWGSKKGETRLISNRIAPFWGQSLNIQGKQNKIVELMVVDNKGNKLQWMKLDPKQIRIMYPYHLHIYFREEYIGLNPHFYMTVIREDVPLFSVLDRKINMKVKYIGPTAPQKSQQYVLIYPKQLQGNQMNKLPIFIDLNMKNYISFQLINKMIEQNPQKKYQWTNWNLLVPINTHPTSNEDTPISILKSFLNKSLVCMYFTIEDSKSLFFSQIWNSVNVLEKKEGFENSIKQIYYEEKKIIVGKAVQFSNLDTQQLQNEKREVSLEEKWKILTHNYVLRNKLLTKSIHNTQSLKKSIKQKGEYLEQLKKILIQVKKVNAIMVEKQKSSLIQQSREGKKIRQNFSQYKTIEIAAMLLQKQVQLEKVKKINDEMRMRMDSLHYFNEDSQQLDKIVVENAERLLQQQVRIKQMNKMRQAIPKQRQVIARLQKIFEKREIDKEMNTLLEKQQNKLNQLKKVNNTSLQKVYNIVKEHKNTPHSLLQSIKAAERELINLNAQYAKLTTI